MMPLVRSSDVELVFRVETRDDVPLLQAAARQRLVLMGFDAHTVWCVLIATSEAATNAVKHAGGGTISIAWLGEPPHLVLEAVDEGKGIDDPEMAMRDFISEGEDLRSAGHVPGRRGNGTGLGSIARLMDTLSLENRSGGGLRLVARKLAFPRPLLRSTRPRGR